VIVRVRLGLDRAEMLQSGSVVGALWLDLEGEAFPERGWIDLPVPVVTSWIEALRAFASPEPVRAELRFMEGPFELRLDWVDEVAMATLLRMSRPVADPIEVDLDELLDSVLTQGRNLAATAKRHGWASLDLDALARTLDPPE